LLKAINISKRYGIVHALNNVDFELLAGEVHALMGENGAGKSTLAKILSGIELPDSGAIEIEGKRVTIENPRSAINQGIAIVTQEFNSAPHLPVYENIFLGHQDIFKGGVILNKKEAIKKTVELLTLFGMENQINPLSKLHDLAVAEQQIIEILKAVSHQSKIIILDEPTASLTSKETARLFEVINQLKVKGVGFIVVSHRFNEIFEISDRITVLRDGNLVLGGCNMKEMDEQRLVKAMVGREIKEFFGEKKAQVKNAKPILQVKNITDMYDFLKNVSFDAYPGEILGFSGLVGAGRTSLARCVFGADNYKTGEVLIGGKKLRKYSPKESIRAGMSFATENRKEEGLFINLSILINCVFAKTASKKGSLLPHKSEQSDCQSITDKIRIRYGNYYNPAKSLSGGNQQKLVFAKWMLTKPKILLLDEPTRGIDISAKTEIYNIIYDLVSQGVCVIIISSELPEILGICDRVLVMRDGAIVGDMEITNASEEIIMSYASFGNRGDAGTTNC
jgi:ABC-type sugar transport system ATPase subunit